MNANVAAKTRRRLEMQGFTGHDDNTLRQIRGWLRAGPEVCGIWMAIGLWQRSPGVIAAVAIFAALGTILPAHPLDVFYNQVIRRWRGGPQIPRYGRARRFSCAMAASTAGLAALALNCGSIEIAFVLGCAFMAATMMNVTTDFCPGAWIYSGVCRIRENAEAGAGLAVGSGKHGPDSAASCSR